MARPQGDLKTKLLLAAVGVTGGDLSRVFTIEELLLAAWEKDNMAWGLRGHEQAYPDSERICKELDSRGTKSKDPIALGYIERVRARQYRLTAKGLEAASTAAPQDPDLRAKADRELEDKLNGILGHPVFHEWLKDQLRPRSFRDAAYFWRISPGTPPRVARQRISAVDHILDSAADRLRNGDEVLDNRGRVLFTREDLAHARHFVSTLRERFQHDLATILGQVDQLSDPRARRSDRQG